MAEIYSKSQTFTDAALFIGAVSVFLIEQRAGRNFEPILEFVPNRHHPVLIVGIARPNRHLVIFLPDLYPSSANLTNVVKSGHVRKRLTSSLASSKASPIKHSSVSSQMRSRSAERFFLSFKSI